MRRRAQRPEPFEVAECIRLSLYPRGGCPDPERLATLNARIAAWEQEQERLKDPVGFIVRSLSAEGGDITFRDASKPDKPMVRLGYYRPERLERRILPVSASVSEFLVTPIAATDLAVEAVWMPKIDLAEDVELSTFMLRDEEWDHEDEICEQLRWHAARLTRAAPASTEASDA